MKRSEMIDHIKEELLDFYETYKNISSPKAAIHKLNSRAAGILDMVEGFGMLPPTRKVSYQNGIGPKNNNGLIEFDTNEWEPEDGQ